MHMLFVHCTVELVHMCKFMVSRTYVKYSQLTIMVTTAMTGKTTEMFQLVQQTVLY